MANKAETPSPPPPLPFRMGLHRHLSAGHMVDQVVITKRLFQREVGAITNVVFMVTHFPHHHPLWPSSPHDVNYISN